MEINNNIMGKIVAIGGGEIGELDTLAIDRRIVKLAGKKRLKVLFIPTASGDAEGYCETFKEVYGDKLKCRIDFLLLVKEKETLTKKDIADKILKADIIYVGGGDTLKMLQVWKKFGVDKLLKKAYKKRIILSGISAGAICWFDYGVSDAVRSSKNEKLFGRVQGLKMVPVKKSITISPHNIREKRIRELSIEEIMSRTSGVCLAIDDNAALFIQEEIDPVTKKQIQKYEIWQSRKNVGITKYFKKDGVIKKEKLPEEGDLDWS